MQLEAMNIGAFDHSDHRRQAKSNEKISINTTRSSTWQTALSQKSTIIVILQIALYLRRVNDHCEITLRIRLEINTEQFTVVKAHQTETTPVWYHLRDFQLDILS